MEEKTANADQTHTTPWRKEGLVGQRGCCGPAVNGRGKAKPQERWEGMGGFSPWEGDERQGKGGGGYLSIGTPGTISQSPLS